MLKITPQSAFKCFQLHKRPSNNLPLAVLGEWEEEEGKYFHKTNVTEQEKINLQLVVNGNEWSFKERTRPLGMEEEEVDQQQVDMFQSHSMTLAPGQRDPLGGT